ncbi:hypothetical protein TGMAS_416210 [Toxoplasma gondii MAS]|uniref:Uncharacterized protein n=1 Tax=Toxoplasma gondii MAS TaxID=943118 RepID=A0A086PYZ4_TOXGO|nr:hypothetical protein TGMAS_416210 [Toxoplasma gondii MAS]
MKLLIGFTSQIPGEIEHPERFWNACAIRISWSSSLDRAVAFSLTSSKRLPAFLECCVSSRRRISRLLVPPSWRAIRTAELRRHRRAERENVTNRRPLQHDIAKQISLKEEKVKEKKEEKVKEKKEEKVKEKKEEKVKEKKEEKAKEKKKEKGKQKKEEKAKEKKEEKAKEKKEEKAKKKANAEKMKKRGSLRRRESEDHREEEKDGIRQGRRSEEEREGIRSPFRLETAGREAQATAACRGGRGEEQVKGGRRGGRRFAALATPAAGGRRVSERSPSLLFSPREEPPSVCDCMPSRTPSPTRPPRGSPGASPEEEGEEEQEREEDGREEQDEEQTRGERKERLVSVERKDASSVAGKRDAREAGKVAAFCVVPPGNVKRLPTPPPEQRDQAPTG